MTNSTDTESASVGQLKQSFGGPEAAKLIGISYRQLDHWARKGLVTPSVTPATGSGSQRRYSYEDLLELKVIKSLRDAGVSLQRIEKVFDYVRNDLDERTSEIRILFDGSRVYACRSNDEVIDLFNQGQVVFGFALGKVLEELDGQIAELTPQFEAAESAEMSSTDDRPPAAGLDQAAEGR